MNVKFCPYCGNTKEFYVRQSYSGNFNFYMRFDGLEGDNEDMYENAQHKITSKFAYCSKCHKKIFKLVDEEATKKLL